jgi:2-oxoglutarate ferredoxin oxidoreductase subunit gamma
VTEVKAVVMTGRGGQGGKLAMELLAWSVSADGLVPVLYSVYGALIRGGDIASFLAAGPVDPGVAVRDGYDVMCALHNNWFDRYYPRVRPGGVLIVDHIYQADLPLTRTDITHLLAPMSRLATAAGDRRAGSMVAAGMVAAVSGVASLDALEHGMHSVVPSHRADRIGVNLAAVAAGYSWATERIDPLAVTPHIVGVAVDRGRRRSS